MKFFFLVFAALVLLMIAPAMADHFENFQTYTADGWVKTTGWVGNETPLFPATTAWPNSRLSVVGENISARVGTCTACLENDAIKTNSIYWDVNYPSNYYAFSVDSCTFSGGVPHALFLLIDDTKTTPYGMFSIDSYCSAGTAAGEYEIIRNPGTGVITFWRNGTQVLNSPVTSFVSAVPPAYLFFNTFLETPPTTEAAMVIDNVHFGSSDPKYWTGTLPQNWTVIKDFINPALSGVYACFPNGTCPGDPIRTTYMESRWSRGNGTTGNYVGIKSIGTGLYYELLSVNPSQYTGLTRNNLSVLTSPVVSAPFGLYEFTIFGGSGANNHAYFWLLGNGAGVAWDRDSYTEDDVATITYSISPAYWDTATYWYYLRVLDQGLETRYSTPITAISGSKGLTLDGSYEDSDVFYATVYAVKKSDGTEILMNYDYMEMDYDTVITGTCYNATNSTPMTGVNISVEQGAIYNFDNSDPTYRIAGLDYGLPTNVTVSMNGFNNYTFLFTPLAAKTYDIDLPLVPSDLTYPNATIGGRIYSTPYHQPIEGATVHIMNETHYTSTETSLTGWYAFPGLLNNGTYWIYSEKNGFAISSNESVIAQVP